MFVKLFNNGFFCWLIIGRVVGGVVVGLDFGFNLVLGEFCFFWEIFDGIRVSLYLLLTDNVWFNFELYVF